MILLQPANNNFLYSSFPVRLDLPSGFDQHPARKEIWGVWAHPDPFNDGTNRLRQQPQSARACASLTGDIMGSFLSRTAWQFVCLTVHGCAPITISATMPGSE